MRSRVFVRGVPPAADPSTSVTTWVAASVVAVAACSSTSPTQACADLSNAICNKLAECTSSPLIEVYGDAATCAARAAAACEKSLALTDTADSADSAESCAGSYSALSCSDAIDNVPTAACERKDFGKRNDGSSCGAAGQCASGVCQIDATTGCGKCIEPAASGRPCQGTSDCQRGLLCEPAENGSVCVAPVGSGATCSAQIPCQQGLLCVGGTCQPLLAPNSACDPTPGKSLCDGESGYWCTPRGTRCILAKFAQPGQTCGYDATTGDLTACSGSGAGAGVLGACENVDSKTLQGTCAAAAADGAPCSLSEGPYCTPPAMCIAGACKIVDPATCN